MSDTDRYLESMMDEQSCSHSRCHEHEHEHSHSSASANQSTSTSAISSFSLSGNLDLTQTDSSHIGIDTDHDTSSYSHSHSRSRSHSYSHSRPLQLQIQLVSDTGCDHPSPSASPGTSPSASPYQSRSPSLSPSPSPCPPSPSAGLSRNTGHVALRFLERQQHAIHINKHAHIHAPPSPGASAPLQDTWTGTHPNPHQHPHTDHTQQFQAAHTHTHSQSTCTVCGSSSPSLSPSIPLSPSAFASRARSASLSVATPFESDVCECRARSTSVSTPGSSSRSLGASPANWNAFSLKTRYRYRRIHRKSSPNNMNVIQPRPNTLEITINPAEKPEPDQAGSGSRSGSGAGHGSGDGSSGNAGAVGVAAGAGVGAGAGGSDGNGTAADPNPSQSRSQSPAPASSLSRSSPIPMQPSPPNSPPNRAHHHGRPHSLCITSLIIPETQLNSTSTTPDSLNTATFASSSACSDSPASISASVSPSPLPPSSPSTPLVSMATTGSWLQKFRRLKARFHSRSVDLTASGAAPQLAHLQAQDQPQPLPRTESGAIPTIKTFHPSTVQRVAEQQQPIHAHESDQGEDREAVVNMAAESGDTQMDSHGRVPRRVARARDGHSHGPRHGHVRRKSTPVLPTDLSASLADRWRREQRTYTQQQSPIKRRWESNLCKENQLTTQAWDVADHHQDETAPNWTKHDSLDKDECEPGTSTMWSVEKPMSPSLLHVDHSDNSSTNPHHDPTVHRISSRSLDVSPGSSGASIRTLLPSVTSPMNPHMRSGTPAPKAGANAGTDTLGVNPTLKHRRSQSVCLPAVEIPSLDVQVAVPLPMLAVTGPRSPRSLGSNSSDSNGPAAAAVECPPSPVIVAGTPGSSAMNCRRLQQRRPSVTLFLEPELLSSFKRK